jgi:hypothetical protein
MEWGWLAVVLLVVSDLQKGPIIGRFQYFRPCAAAYTTEDIGVQSLEQQTLIMMAAALTVRALSLNPQQNKGIR